MTTFFKNISCYIPFDIQDLVDLSDIQIYKDCPTSNFVHKQSFSSEILNPQFLKFLLSKNIKIQKVIVWNWYNRDSFWAHIDSNNQGVISPCALNWTLNNNSSQVNFYELPNVEKQVRYGNEIDNNSKTENVTSYIPINVQGLEPDAVWDDRGPAVINTSIPHLVIASQMRTSISLNFENPMPSIETILDRLCK